jgi:hypothetical protein
MRFPALATVRQAAGRTRVVRRSLPADVLLMAGAEDHCVPLSQLGDQLAILINAKSVTARMFTATEHAQNHCQVGNLGLALQVVSTG